VGGRREARGFVVPAPAIWRAKRIEDSVLAHPPERLVSLLCFASISLCTAFAGGDNYKNFDVALYSRVYETRQMNDPAWLESHWEAVSKHMKVDKIYLETSRDMVVVDQATLDQAKRFFLSKGVKVSGGITVTVSEANQFETYCYSNPEHRQKLKDIVEFTARNFDEFILDDFFFTDCKADSDIAAKGSRTWTQFRLAQMDEAGRNLVVGPARAVNPKVKIIIKYPNWYDHFQFLGFNLETEPKYFDKIYTGTETRDPSGNQHLQQYHGYSIVRYFENLKPGGNGGGWVDQGGSNIPGRLEEQLWLTLFAKAPEITIFNIGAIYRPTRKDDGTVVPDSPTAQTAGKVFSQVDSFLGQLGKPIGVKTYKPFHSSGEDHLPSYLGMVGIPMDIVPEFPTDAKTVLLTEQARFDPAIVAKMKKQLVAGGTVVMTSGLLKALQGKGIEDIVELEFTGQAVATREFAGRGGRGATLAEPILLPKIRYATNDSWETVSAFTSTNRTSGTPVLLSSKYSKGMLCVLTIPEDEGDLYYYPQNVLTIIRNVVAKDMYVRLDAPSMVSLFVYDNDKFIVESFQENPVTVHVVTDGRISRLRDLVTGQELAGQPQASGGFGGRGGQPAVVGGGGSGAPAPANVFEVPLTRGSYRVFSAN
jgi:hypothetical protein